MYTTHPKALFGEIYREPVLNEDGTVKVGPDRGHICHIQSLEHFVHDVEHRRYVEIANLSPRWDGGEILSRRIKAIVDRCGVFSITVTLDKISAVIQASKVKHFYMLAQGVECDDAGDPVMDEDGNGKLLPGEN